MTGTSSSSAFAPSVHRVVRRIPPGRVTSYGTVAALAGAPRAARGVGAVLNALTPDRDVPWWRVVNRAGVLTIPAELGLRALQRQLLEDEGVAFLPAGTVDLERHAWDPDELDADGLADPVPAAEGRGRRKGKDPGGRSCGA